jgi:hypothetical protein
MLITLCTTTSTAQPPIVSTGTFSETTVAPLSITTCVGPCEDVTVNCDMLEVPGNGMVKAIVWSRNRYPDAWLYVEDYNGNTATVNIAGGSGAMMPDVALAYGINVPGVTGFEVLIVYRIGTNAYLDIYDLTNVGTTSFGLSAASSTLLTTTCSDWPHIDAYADRGYSYRSYRSERLVIERHQCLHAGHCRLLSGSFFSARPARSDHLLRRHHKQPDGA